MVTEFDLFVAECPARTTLSVIADTWAVVPLTALDDGPNGTLSSASVVGGISAEVLTQTARRLEANGLVGLWAKSSELLPIRPLANHKLS